MPSPFVCLDTNILIRIATQGQMGCELECWEELKRLGEAGRITILLPVVVRLEFRKQLRNFSVDFDDEMSKFDKALKALCDDKKGFWNEGGDLVAALASKWAELRSEKIEACKGRFEQINQWLLSQPQCVEFLPYDETIMAAVKRRMFWGGHPRQEKNASRHRLDADLSIIESLIARLRKSKGPEDVLLFCTENIKDFAVTVADTLCLHHHFAFELPANAVFPDLASLLKSVKDNLPVKKPTEDEIEEAEAKAAAEDQVAREMTWVTIQTDPQPSPWAAATFSEGPLCFNPKTKQFDTLGQNPEFAHWWQEQEEERKQRLEEYNRCIIQEYNRTIERNRQNNDPPRPM